MVEQHLDGAFTPVVRASPSVGEVTASLHPLNGRSLQTRGFTTRGAVRWSRMR